jgi:hypothetical protein
MPLIPPRQGRVAAGAKRRWSGGEVRHRGHLLLVVQISKVIGAQWRMNIIAGQAFYLHQMASVMVEDTNMKRTVLATAAALALAVAALPTSAMAQHHGGGGGGHFGGGGPHMGGGGPHFGGGGPHFGGGFHGRGFGPGFAFGFGGPYYDYGYDDGGCYVVRRVPTRFGWRLRRVWVC